ncbi:hypothetical protein C5167_019282 [Papaver somniferum]|uniref:Uncharacterized protein n=1 Tax=Papaver somniferum TaxID=3469 RepID=A0A4Y7IST5_PAPSO|nr:hypothetical protein C5167_019282 [Papaver somniferum]
MDFISVTAAGSTIMRNFSKRKTRIVVYKNYDEMKYVVSTGSNAYISNPLAEMSDEDLILEEVNIDGASSDGMPTPRLQNVLFPTSDPSLPTKHTYIRFLTGLKAYSQISQLDVGDGKEASLERYPRSTHQPQCIEYIGLIA